jgi:MFS family permease
MRRRVIAGTTIGNALEFFDFTVFSFLMLVIGPLFFPEASSYGQLLLTTATFGVGFLMRPVGGMLIGSYADRHGRRAAMALTLWLMGAGCALIAAAKSGCQPRCWWNIRRHRSGASIPAGNSEANAWASCWARWWSRF